MEGKIDPYKHKQRYENWLKDKTIKGISKTNEKIIIKFLDDMALGINISKISKKGARSPSRLNNLKQRITFIAKKLEEREIKDLRKVTTTQLHKLFQDMREGTLKTRRGGAYRSAGDYVKLFKAFWHWYQKVEKKKGKLIEDICEDLDTRGEKPKFVYFTEQDFNNIVKEATADLKPVLSLLFDSGMRVTELMNIKTGDFSDDFKELNIREETSKTFGRKIKLLVCSDHIKSYVKLLNLKTEDLLCQTHPQMINKELRKIGNKVLTPEQIKFKNLTLYDFRHSSACFWLPRYKVESALKYRFGWKKSDMIHYYTEFLGMKDTIKDDDLYLDVTKTELDRKIEKQGKKIEELKEQGEIAAKELDITVKKLEDLKLSVSMLMTGKIHIAKFDKNSTKENPKLAQINYP